MKLFILYSLVLLPTLSHAGTLFEAVSRTPVLGDCRIHGEIQADGKISIEVDGMTFRDVENKELETNSRMIHRIETREIVEIIGPVVSRDKLVIKTSNGQIEKINGRTMVFSRLIVPVTLRANCHKD